MPDDVRGIGDNQPPASALVLADLREYLIGDDATLAGLAAKVAEALPSMLDEQSVEINEETDNLATVCARWDAERPEILNDDHASKAANLKDRLKAQRSKIEAWHKANKAPFLQSGRTVDNSANAKLDIVDAMTSKMLGRLQKWQDKIRADRESEAKRQRDEAQRLAEAAREQQEAGNVTSAQSLETHAADLQEQAQELTSAPVQIRSDHGALVTERKTWEAEILNEAKIPKKYLSVDDKKIKADIKRMKDAKGDPATLSIDGVLRIFVKTTVL